MNPFSHTGLSISDSLKFVRKSVLIYETIILAVISVAISIAFKVLENHPELIEILGIIYLIVIMGLGIIIWRSAKIIKKEKYLISVLNDELVARNNNKVIEDIKG